jgi:sugar/nucleoside kinase (ribokinase family)
MAPRVAVIGYLSIDTISTPSHCVVEIPGGGALYSALAARSVGAAVTLFASVGEDYPTDTLALINRVGIETSFMKRGAVATRRAKIEHLIDGARVSSHYRDPRWWEATEALVPPLPSALDSFDTVVINAVPPSILHEALSRAACTGVTTVVDTNEVFALAGRDAILADLAGMSLFAASREETRILCPRMDDDAAAHDLASRGPVVVQKRGAQGIFVAHSHHRAESFPAVSVALVDPTGAGDAFVGALAASLSGPAPIQDAIRTALSIAARTASAFGPRALGLTARQASDLG